jgi:magnesium chelatase family protein
MHSVFSVARSKHTLVRVEAAVASGYGGIQLVGNAKEACKEGKDRAYNALKASGFKMSEEKVLLSLSPADLQKEGNHFDLAYAMAITCLFTKDIPSTIEDCVFYSELGLQGELRAAKGLIAAAITAQRSGKKRLICAKHDPQVRSIPQGLGIEILAFSNLVQIFNALKSDWQNMQPYVPICKTEDDEAEMELDYSDMSLTADLEKLAICCATGSHSLLLNGPPGSGKSMFCERLPSLLPDLNEEKRLESLFIHSATDQALKPSLLRGRPPFRAPHHQASSTAICGHPYLPGDISLAHNGVLLLDEIREFRRDVLESLREPLENRRVHISRAQIKAEWPADFQLLATSNPCPCGWFGSEEKLCRCAFTKLQAYRNKLSGPLLDRISLHYILEPSDKPANIGDQLALKSAVADARSFAMEKGRMKPLDLWEIMRPHLKVGHEFFSRRSLMRCLYVAETLSFMDQSEVIKTEHLDQAYEWQHEYQSKKYEKLGF